MSLQEAMHVLRKFVTAAEVHSVSEICLSEIEFEALKRILEACENEF